MPADDEAEERRLEREITQGCLDWVKDMGDCHMCGFANEAEHDDECPVGKLSAFRKEKGTR